MISLRGVTKRFDGTGGDAAVGDLSMDIARGETVVLVGPSGCGKTTTMRMINRLIEPSSGEIYVDGKSVMRQDPVILRGGAGGEIPRIRLAAHRTGGRNIESRPALLGWAGQRAGAPEDER